MTILSNSQSPMTSKAYRDPEFVLAIIYYNIRSGLYQNAVVTASQFSRQTGIDEARINFFKACCKGNEILAIFVPSVIV